MISGTVRLASGIWAWVQVLQAGQVSRGWGKLCCTPAEAATWIGSVRAGMLQ